MSDFGPGLASAANDVSSRFNIRGLYCDENGVIFRYVLAEDGDIAATNVCCYATNYGAVEGPHNSSTRNAGEVTDTSTSAIIAGSGLGNTAATASGVAAGDITDNQYGFLVVSGLCTAKADGSIAKGDCLVVDGGATPNVARFDTAVAGEEAQVVGLALADDSATAVSAILRCIL